MPMWSFIASRGDDLGPDALTGAHGPDVLRRQAVRHGLDMAGISITLDGDTVRLTGRARDTDTREKIILAVGNVRGIALVRDDVRDRADPHFYTVVPGDTLPEIARITLGDASRHAEVFEANRPMLAAPDALYYGQVLRIPRL